MEAYYTAKLLPGSNNTAQTYEIWRNKNQDSKPGIDANNLANQRRYTVYKDSKSCFQQSTKKTKTGLGGQTTSPLGQIPNKNHHILRQI